MSTRFIIRIWHAPVEFPRNGGPYSTVPSDEQATGFETRREAIDELVKRRIGFKGVAVIEVPLEGLRMTGGPQ